MGSEDSGTAGERRSRRSSSSRSSSEVSEKKRMADDERRSERRRSGSRRNNSSRDGDSSRGSLKKSSSGKSDRQRGDRRSASSSLSSRDAHSKEKTRSLKSSRSAKSRSLNPSVTSSSRSKSKRRRKKQEWNDKEDWKQSSDEDSDSDGKGGMSKGTGSGSRTVISALGTFSLSSALDGAAKRLLWNGLHARVGKSLVEFLTGVGLRELVDPASLAAPDRSDVDSDKILSVQVHGMESLQTNAWVSHPVVRVSLVDSRTGKYFTKASKKGAGSVLFREGASLASVEVETGGSSFRCKREASACAMIPPQVTEPSELGACKTDTQSVSWLDQGPLLFNVPARHLLDPAALLFFEVLDFGPAIEPAEQAAADGFYPIAWGFLKLSNAAGAANFSVDGHANKPVRLQLYKFPTNSWAFRSVSDFIEGATTPGAGPRVFHAFRLNRRQRYPSSLAVEVAAAIRPEPVSTLRGVRPASVFQLEGTQKQSSAAANVEDSNDLVQALVSGSAVAQLADGAAAGGSMSAAALLSARRHRLKHEPCIIPTELLCRLPAGNGGSFDAQFSPDGLYLAAACSEGEGATAFAVKVFDSTTMALMFTLLGHQSLIYQLAWQKAELEPDAPLRLASASADGTVRLWSIPNGVKRAATDLTKHDKQGIEDENRQARGNNSDDELLGETKLQKKKKSRNSATASTASSEGFAQCEHVLRHSPPTYVYTIQVHPTAYDPPVLATGSYDGFVRFWDCHTGKVLGAKGDGKLDFGRAHHKSNVNALCFTKDGNRLVSGDGAGVVIVWRLETGRQTSNPDAWHVARKLEDPDLVGKSITSIQVHPVERMLLVAAQQNTIRLFELRRYTRVHQGFIGAPVSRSLIRATFSPDGQFVISGSEAGKPFVWDTHSAQPAGSRWKFGFPKPLCSLAWHPSQHLVVFCCFGGPFSILVYEASRDMRDFDAAPIRTTALIDDDDEVDARSESLDAAPVQPLEKSRSRRLAESLDTIGESDDERQDSKPPVSKVKGINTLRERLSGGDLASPQGRPASSTDSEASSDDSL